MYANSLQQVQNSTIPSVFNTKPASQIVFQQILHISKKLRMSPFHAMCDINVNLCYLVIFWYDSTSQLMGVLTLWSLAIHWFQTNWSDCLPFTDWKLLQNFWSLQGICNKGELVLIRRFQSLCSDFFIDSISHRVQNAELQATCDLVAFWCWLVFGNMCQPILGLRFNKISVLEENGLPISPSTFSTLAIFDAWGGISALRYRLRETSK